MMTKYEKFVESLYKMSEKELKEYYKFLRMKRDEISQKLAEIMYKYMITDGVMDISRVDRIKLKEEIRNEITTMNNIVGEKEVALTEDILTLVVKDTFEYWNYNIGFKDVQNILKEKFKGKHFSDRVWENENLVTNKLNSQIKAFINGKINVNQIKREIEKTFNNGAYNTKRLVETEVGRVHDESFKRFCRETGVKKIKRNAVLDGKTCNDCTEYDGKIYDLDDAPVLPVHPLCRCFYEIVE